MKQPSAAPVLSWIVPLYRNSGFILETIFRCHAAANEADISSELVFVDDACPEKSGLVAGKLAAPAPLDVRVLMLPVNRGQDSAIREGLRNSRGAHSLIIDGDLQDPPEILPILWSEMKARPCDVVFAARLGDYESRSRLTTSIAYKKAMEWIGRLPPKSGVCALLNQRAITSVACTRVARISILAALAGAKLRYSSCGVARNRRLNGDSAYTSRMRVTRAIHSLAQTFRARTLGIPL